MPGTGEHRNRCAKALLAFVLCWGALQCGTQPSPGETAPSPSASGTEAPAPTAPVEHSPKANTLHLAEIDHAFESDPYGRPVLQAWVMVHDGQHKPLSDVLVRASIAPPGGVSVERERYTKADGQARFHWGANSHGTWTVCVLALSREGWTYRAAGDEVEPCASWESKP